MVSEVNKLIFNTLITQGAVHIPTIGTLFIERLATDSSSRSRVVAPRYGLHFSSHQDAVSLVEVIAHEANIDTPQAQDIVERWIDKVRTENGIAIEGIGVLNNKSFLVDKEFVRLLNPLGFEEIEITKSHSRSVWPYLLTLIIVSALTIGGWYLYRQYTHSENIDTPDNSARENVDNVNITELDTDKEQGSSITIIEQTAEATTENPELEIDELSEESRNEDWRQNSDLRHWVVVGSYSTIDNAERAIAELQRRYSGHYFRHFRLGSMYGVSPFASSDKAECEVFSKRYSSDFPQMWIYTPKRYRD